MSLFARMTAPLTGIFPSVPLHPAESSAEALQRVEAECDWSDAPALFAEMFAPPAPPSAPDFGEA